MPLIKTFFANSFEYVNVLCYETICLVKSHSQDAAANLRANSLLSYSSSVTLSSVVH